MRQWRRTLQQSRQNTTGNRPEHRQHSGGVIGCSTSSGVQRCGKLRQLHTVWKANRVVLCWHLGGRGPRTGDASTAFVAFCLQRFLLQLGILMHHASQIWVRLIIDMNTSESKLHAAAGCSRLCLSG
jgi:hypothetical protein